MKPILFIILMLCSCYCVAQNISDKTWKIQSSAVVVNGDTAYLFRNTVQNNLYQLSKISYRFNSSGTYSGTSVDSTAMNGSWSQPSDQIVIDGVTSAFQLIDSMTFAISAPFTIRDTLGNTAPATSMLRFYYTPAITDFELSVFPNPFNTALNVRIQSPAEFEAGIELRNAVGQLVYTVPSKTYPTQSSFSIPLKSLPAGVYHFILTGDHLSESRKIIKL